MKSNQSPSVPVWDLFGEYPSIKSKEVEIDRQAIKEGVLQIEELSRTLLDNSFTEKSAKHAQQITSIKNEIEPLLQNLSTFASCLFSVDGTDQDAKQLKSQTQSLSASLARALKPLQLLLIKAPEEFVELYLDSKETRPEKFLVTHYRRLRKSRLSVSEEQLISRLSVDGFTAWGNLYNQLSSTLSCEIEIDKKTRRIGFAEASGMLRGGEEAKRKAAWFAIGRAWETKQESCASALSAITGWRISLCQRRKEKAPFHFLDEALHQARIEKQTLDAMMEAVDEARPMAQQVLQVAARLMGKKTLDPWDRLAPAPNKQNSENSSAGVYSFEEAIECVSTAFAQISPDMGDFVTMMAKNRWIEAKVRPHKSPGAYCTRFRKSRTPRVFMTFIGSIGDVKTLAHELGHAYHGWAMRDLPLSQTYYPMTLAETASVFAETVVSDFLDKKVTHPQEQFANRWKDAFSAVTFLLDIPSRFSLETSLYTERKQGVLTPARLKTLTEKSWKKYYGNDLSQMDSMFWASKLHFYLTGISFYNFPYTFGYLFSLLVYQQRKKNPENFSRFYQNLLRDTGTMTAEDLIKEYFDADARQASFWAQGIEIVAEKVSCFVDDAEKMLQD